METFNNLLNAVPLLNMGISAVGLIQEKRILDAEIRESRSRHMELMNLENLQHGHELKTTKQTYLMELYHQLEQHFQQLNADLIASSKESERDMFDQRNQSFQTIILASSVMFTALSTVIVQGNLPADLLTAHTPASDFAFLGYSITSALSFALLFICIVLCIEIVTRSSKFMYIRAENQAQVLSIAIRDTTQMMNRLHGEPTSTRGSGGNGKKKIAQMTSEEVENEFKNHQKFVDEYLTQREKVNEKLSKGITINNENKTFQDFWKESCETWAVYAVLCFYLGTMCLLFAIMIFMWFQFFITYSSLLGAVLAVVFIGLSLVIGIMVRLYIQQQNEQLKEDDIDNLREIPSPPNDIASPTHEHLHYHPNDVENNNIQNDAMNTFNHSNMDSSSHRTSRRGVTFSSSISSSKTPKTPKTVSSRESRRQNLSPLVQPLHVQHEDYTDDEIKQI